MTVPEAVAGTLPIAVVARDAAGVAYGASVEVDLAPASSLVALSVEPANVRFVETGFDQSLAVEGRYEDEVIRDLTDRATGTTYSTSDPAVVAVDANGRLTAQGNGTAQVTVSNGQVNAIVTIVVSLAADLAIAQTGQPDPVPTGGEILYSIDVVNNGDQAALALQVTDVLPAGVSFVEVAGTGWSCVEAIGEINCYRDQLAAGASASITVRGQAPMTPGVVTNQVTVWASTDDPFIDDNISTLSLPVTEPTESLTVRLTGGGDGTVTSVPAGIDCGDDCQEDYPIDTAVTLTATPEAEHSFAGWGGDCSGTQATCQLTMATAREVTATFTAPIPERGLTVTLTGDGVGTVSSNPAGIDCGDDCREDYPIDTAVTLTATPGAGHSFAGWGGDCSGTQATCQLTMATAREVTATFTAPIPERSLSVTLTGDGVGTVMSNPAGIDCGDDCHEDYPIDTPVMLTAMPEAGHGFAGWGGDCSGTQATCQLTMATAREVTATFTAPDAPCPAETTLRDQPDRSAREALLTQVRDRLMATSPDGRWMVEAYYRHAEEVSARLASDAALRRQALGLLYRLREDLAQMARGVTPELAAGDRAAIRAFAVKLQRGASTGLAEDLRRFLALDWSEPRNGRAKNGE